MPLAFPPNIRARLLRAAADRHFIPGCPQSIDHIMVVADQHAGSRDAIDFAIGLAEHLSARLTLMHGGNLRSDPAFWTSDSLDNPDPNQARLALLGLLWDIRKRCPELGLCTMDARWPEQVFRAAAQYGADLLVLPEDLFDRFLPLVSRTGQEEVVEGAPCPMLVVGDHPVSRPVNP